MISAEPKHSFFPDCVQGCKCSDLPDHLFRSSIKLSPYRAPILLFQCRSITIHAKTDTISWKTAGSPIGERSHNVALFQRLITRKIEELLRPAAAPLSDTARALQGISLHFTSENWCLLTVPSPIPRRFAGANTGHILGLPKTGHLTRDRSG